MYDGILLNAAVSTIGGGAYLALVRKATRDARTRAALALALFFTAVGLHLVLAGTRQLVAYAALAPGARESVPFLDLTALDLTLFLVTTIVGAATVIPLAFYACELKAPRHSVRATLALTAFAAAGLALFLLAPKTGPIPSRWGSDWAVSSLPVSIVLGIAVALPAGASCVALLRSSEEATRTLGFAVLVYYGAIIPDALGLTGTAFVVARIAAASSALLAYEATRRPFGSILESIAHEGHTPREPSAARAQAPIRPDRR